MVQAPARKPSYCLVGQGVLCQGSCLLPHRSKQNKHDQTYCRIWVPVSNPLRAPLYEKRGKLGAGLDCVCCHMIFILLEATPI